MRDACCSAIAASSCCLLHAQFVIKTRCEGLGGGLQNDVRLSLSAGECTACSMFLWVLPQECMVAPEISCICCSSDAEVCNSAGLFLALMDSLYRIWLSFTMRHGVLLQQDQMGA